MLSFDPPGFSGIGPADHLRDLGINVVIDNDNVGGNLQDHMAVTYYFKAREPTLNNQLYPSLMDFITYMKGLKPLNKIGAAFGSYGWSGEAVKMLNKELEAMKFDVIDPGLRVQYVPDQDALEASYELGRKIGRAVNG